MKKKTVDAAKLGALFCVPSVLLLAALAAQRYNTAVWRPAAQQAATKEMIWDLKRVRDGSELYPLWNFKWEGSAAPRPTAKAVADTYETKEWLRRGASVSARDEYGATPLHIAAQSAASQILILLEHGADVNARTKVGLTPLMYAAGEGNSEAVLLLLRRGAHVNDVAVFAGRKHTALSEAREGARKTRSSGWRSARTTFDTIIHMLKAAGAKEQMAST
jgi:hypothetical protein